MLNRARITFLPRDLTPMLQHCLRRRPLHRLSRQSPAPPTTPQVPVAVTSTTAYATTGAAVAPTHIKPGRKTPTKVQAPIAEFEEALPAFITDSLARLGIESPTAIQSAAIPVISSGERLVVVGAPTGTGKTLAYLLPVLAKLKTGVGFQALFVTPHAELAVQVYDVTVAVLQGKDSSSSGGGGGGGSSGGGASSTATAAASAARVAKVRPALAVGSVWAPSTRSSPQVGSSTTGGSTKGQRSLATADSGVDVDDDDTLELESPERLAERLLAEQPGIVVATPKVLSAALAASPELTAAFATTSTLVLDEVDSLLRPPSKYAPHKQRRKHRRHPRPARALVDTLLSVNPHIQLVLCSATVNAPLKSELYSLDWPRLIAPPSMVQAGRATSVPPAILHRYVALHSEASLSAKLRALHELLDHLVPPSGYALAVFHPSTSLTYVKEWFNERDISTQTVFEATKRSERDVEFGTSRVSPASSRLLLSNTITCRGMDLPGLRHVFCMTALDAPNYVHVAGRTGRAGGTGTAVTIAAAEELPKLTRLSRYLSVELSQLHLPTQAGRV